MPDPSHSLHGQRVVLGLSGGVDSAVAALLLKERGADVHALHMTNWDDEDGYCTAAEDLQDARRVCEQLDIPLHHVNFSRQYRDRVFAYFLDEYRAGRTPNPDVLCNREIKFGTFRRHAKRLGGDLLATGHYARLVRGPNGAELWKGVDPNKDQTYFLHQVDPEALDESLFPLGELTKPDVRTIARDRGLATSNKKDSTGICFIGERPFREFLQRYLPAQPGDMVTPEGEKVGEHAGLMYYTYGQRQGLGIGGRRDAGEDAWYVADKDVLRNRLVVVQGDHPLLYSDAVDISDVHWLGPVPATSARLKVKIRYRQEDQPCRLSTLDDGRWRVRFDAPQRAAAPGQFAVFYDDERCLGGGVIARLDRSYQYLEHAM